jgi:hypothetical protein
MPSRFLRPANYKDEGRPLDDVAGHVIVPWQSQGGVEAVEAIAAAATLQTTPAEEAEVVKATEEDEYEGMPVMEWESPLTTPAVEAVKTTAPAAEAVKDILTERERAVARMLNMMMGSVENKGSECEANLNEEFAAVWHKMQQGAV